MGKQSITANDIPLDRLIPAEPIMEGAGDLTQRLQGLLDGQPKDDATVSRVLDGMNDLLDEIAAGMYNMASMLVGEGEDGVRLVETTIANTDLACCPDPAVARQNARRVLCEAALDILSQRDAASLAAPEGLEHASTCIDDDDLDAAGVSGKELEQMMAGPERNRVRTWLSSLPTAMRVIFVMRGVAGFTAADTAHMLVAHGGPQAAGWTPDAVREFTRQSLCSLASQLIQATTR
jgi:DNA-directed RNA polymerase specialized sigma24 family protein